MRLRLPSPGVITSGFGWRKPGKVGSAYHQGVDFGWGNGWTIYAAAAGTVTFAGYQAGYGNLTIIDHGNGVETRYAHQSSFSVRRGDKVWAGQAIGVIGNTGTSAGAHLHFELLTNGRRVDPVPYFASTAGDDITPINPEEEEEEDEMRVLYLYWEGDSSPKGVIGTINRAFRTAVERAHFINVWGTESAPKNGAKIGSVVTSAAFVSQLLTLHTNVDVIAATVAKLIPVVSGGASPAEVAAAVDAILQDDFAAVVEAIPTEFTITGK